jgi:predicted ribosomally synthesized peptide with SipW-like signal peptide
MKKIFGLTIAALLVMGLVGGGTWAYFSDPETSTGNYFSAGTLDLDINDGDAAVTLFSVGDLYPGQTGNASADLDNTGSLSGNLSIEFSAITNNPGTGGTEWEGGSGELGAELDIAIFIDKDEDGAWTTGDVGLKTDNTTYNWPTALEYSAVDNYGSDNWTNAYAGLMANGASDAFVIAYDLPTTAGNNIQGDNVTFSIYFLLKQQGMP